MHWLAPDAGDLTANNILLVDAKEGDSREFSAKVRISLCTRNRLVPQNVNADCIETL